MSGSDGRSPAADVVDPGALRAATEVLGQLAHLGAPLGPRTTYRVGGAAAVLVEVTDLVEMGTVARAHQASGLPVLVVGRGSNLLIDDGGFPGIAMVLSARDEHFTWVRTTAGGVEAGGALALPVLARRSVEAGFTGFEWAVGVPGSLGGAVAMNAGGHGSDMARSVVAATVATLDIPPGADGAVATEVWDLTRLDYSYRRSSIGPHHVVVGARLGLGRGDRAAGAETMRAIVRWRRQHQPGGQNAGSVFTNPVGPEPSPSAGRLVEAAGLKGRRLGSAEVSAKHANFIQADPGGSAVDVVALMDLVRTEVRLRFGVDLHSELRRAGSDQGSDTRSPNRQLSVEPEGQGDDHPGRPIHQQEDT